MHREIISKSFRKINGNYHGTICVREEHIEYYGKRSLIGRLTRKDALADARKMAKDLLEENEIKELKS